MDSCDGTRRRIDLTNSEWRAPGLQLPWSFLGSGTASLLSESMQQSFSNNLGYDCYLIFSKYATLHHHLYSEGVLLSHDIHTPVVLLLMVFHGLREVRLFQELKLCNVVG